MIMKSLVLDMMKYSLFFVFTTFYAMIGSAQNMNEREHRIRKSQFPKNALAYIQNEIVDAKRIRFYKEVDSTKIYFTAKFRKDRLKYSIEFNTDETINSLAFTIQSLDIPEGSYMKMINYLEQHFRRYKIRRLEQQYLLSDYKEETTAIKQAFQNLIVPNVIYELVVFGKQNNKLEPYEVHFNANGSLNSIKKSLPTNYDHILY